VTIAWAPAVHALATCAMCGLIWFVQVVHYPLFRMVDADRFEAFAAEHQRRTSRVVVPLMLTELVTAVLLLLATDVPRSAALLGLALLAVIWASTAWLQVPQHRRLVKGRDLAAIDRLVRTNWIRTGAWSARAMLSVSMLGAWG
jgi:hypothetical protein